MNQKGFTLIEYVVYIGIVAFVLISAVSFAWMIINDQIKQEADINVNSNGFLILEDIAYYVERADNIDLSTIYGSNPGRIVLNYVTNPQITFDTYQKQVQVGDVQVMITKLRMQEGASPAVDLTSDDVDVDNFVILDYSKPGLTTLEVFLNLNAVNPSKAHEYGAKNSWSTAITLRKF